MNIKTSVFKRASRMKKTKRKDADGEPIQVKVRGGWIYRIRYENVDGKPCTIERGFFDLKSAAKDAMKIELHDLEKSDGNSVKGKRMTFNSLADESLKTFYKEAHIVEGHKKSGVKSLAPVLSAMKPLRAYFGPRRISAITVQSLFKYRDSRMQLQPPLKEGGKPRQLKIATVHRELGILRRIMGLAVKEDWITKDIFSKADGLFETTRETPRTRILTLDEERRLLAACAGEIDKTYKRIRLGKLETVKDKYSFDHRHLRAAIILALDGGLRRGEIKKMEWADIDFDGGYINVLSSNTKTEKPRIIPLSARAARELQDLRELNIGDRPFPIADMRHAFATVKKLAKIRDLHFHDLRATCGDRMSKVYPLSTVAKVLGHQNESVTQKHYVGNTVESVREIGQWLDNQQRGDDGAIHSRFVN